MRQIALCLALAAASSLAGAACLPIVGTVQLTPIPDCSVLQIYSGMQGQTYLGECFTDVIKLVGFQTATGYSGVTSEMISSELPYGGAAASPASVPVNQLKRELLTARSTFSLRQINAST